MNKAALIALVLCGSVVSCHTEKDTGERDLWPRSIEARVDGMGWQPCETQPLAPGQVVFRTRCTPAAEASDLDCSDVRGRAEAVRLFAVEHRCRERAIEKLETIANTDPSALNDLAAAYFVRAQDDDWASDLFLALDTAARAPKSPASQFNVALFQETIGLRDEAIASWAAVLEERSGWASEARGHLERLQAERVLDPRVQWDRNRRQIADALRRKDRAALASLIAPFPKKALQYFEEELLPQADPASFALYGSVLSQRLGGSRYVLDVAAAAPRNREGQRLFAQARRAESAMQLAAATSAYEAAARLLRAGGSPLHLEAEMGRAVMTAMNPPSLASLDAIESEIRERKDDYLFALFRSARGYVLFRQTRYIESNQDDHAAAGIFARFQDAESLASVFRTTAGNYTSMAQHELAARDALKAMRYARNAPDSRIRQMAAAEAASAARAMGFHEIALQFQDSAENIVRAEIAATPPENLERIQTLLAHLASVLRNRSGIEAAMQQYADARRDLDEARRLRPATSDASNARTLDALFAGAEADTLLRFNAAAAVTTLTRAIENVGPDELRSFRASLFAKRAAARRRLKRDREAESDLQAALRELNIEEMQILDRRRRGEAEEVWASYFARFKPIYDELIAHLAAQRRVREAFAYAERARGFEPLQLVLQLELVPREFRRLTAGRQPITLEGIQSLLADGTYLLEYSVTADRTFVWIVARNGVRFIELPVAEREVKRWTATLQKAGHRRDPDAFVAGLGTPFEQLFARPLAEIEAMRGMTRLDRLVIIPDGAMNGLPFAALRSPATRRYLIELAPIEIAGSASLYAFSVLRDREMHHAPPSALLAGDPAFDPELAPGLGRLPAALREVASIGEVYAPRAELLLGSKATVERFLARARDQSIVHFAGHAIVNPRDPSRSLLLLAPSATHRGALEARELLTKLDLRSTRLVFLSACSSAGGYPVGPEGVAPLVRPLIAAGVPAVAGSLWDVEDATAARVSVSFHRRYGQGLDAAAALQDVQLEMLRNEGRELHSVLSWAPFQVVGHASSPFGATDKH